MEHYRRLMPESAGRIMISNICEMKDGNGNTLKVGDTVRLKKDNPQSFLSKAKVRQLIGEKFVMVKKCNPYHIPVHTAVLLEKVE